MKLECTRIIEKSLGRELTKNEEVHHMDHDKHNNDIDNLELMSKLEHFRLHTMGDRYMKFWPDKT